MDEMRAMLDSLMGKDRNSFGNETKKRVSFRDDEVCKYFLLDFCPHDLFPNTRSDLGPCPKEHRADLKTQFESDPNRDYYKAIYENDFQKFLRRLVEQMENRIKRVQQRIDPASEPAPKDQEEKLANLKKNISELLQKQNEAGALGDFEMAEKLNDQVQSLQQQVNELMGGANENSGTNIQLRVCNVCGALQSVGDAAVRFEAHASGKQHTGFLKIRQTLAQLESQQDARNKTLNSRPHAFENDRCRSDSREGRGIRDHPSGGRSDKKRERDTSWERDCRHATARASYRSADRGSESMYAREGFGRGSHRDSYQQEEYSRSIDDRGRSRAYTNKMESRDYRFSRQDHNPDYRPEKRHKSTRNLPEENACREPQKYRGRTREYDGEHIDRPCRKVDGKRNENHDREAKQYDDSFRHEKRTKSPSETSDLEERNFVKSSDSTRREKCRRGAEEGKHRPSDRRIDECTDRSRMISGSRKTGGEQSVSMNSRGKANEEDSDDSEHEGGEGERKES